MKRLPLGHGLCALVDDEDYEFVRRFRWYALRRSNKQGRYVYSHFLSRGGTVYLHRLLLLPEPDLEVDHVNGNGLDNRRANLRVATPSQNKSNRATIGGTSAYKGVSLSPETRRRKRWRARIMAGRREVHLGRFLTEAEAALAYNEAARAIFGEFAVLNEVAP
jgi:hypothetical protein